MVAAEPEDHRHRDFVFYDFGQATATMMLIATDLGIGSGHSAVADQARRNVCWASRVATGAST
jgi:hypothetical protein